MKMINTYANFIPYLYFIAVTAYWFTDINRSDGISAYPILLFGIPFLWQIIKPNRRLNFSLGITFACLSSYLIIAYLADILDMSSLAIAKGFILYAGLFVITNFVMSIWILRNGFKRSF